MSQNYQDPNQQPDQWGQQRYDPNQQSSDPNQQPDQWGQQRYDPNQQQNQTGQQWGQDPMGGAKQMATQQIDQAIDQFAKTIPGGQQYVQQAKEAVGGILDTLQQQAQQEAKNRFGDQGGQFGNS